MTSISTVIGWSVHVPLVWHLYRPLSSALISLHCNVVAVILSKGRVLFSLTHCISQCLLSRETQWSLSEVPAITSMVDNDVSTSSDSAWPLYNCTLRDGSRPIKHSKHCKKNYNGLKNCTISITILTDPKLIDLPASTLGVVICSSNSSV